MTVVFNETTLLSGTDDGGGDGGINMRVVLAPALLTAASGNNQIRVTFACGTADSGGSVTDAYVGQLAATGNGYSFTGDQVKLTFSSSGSFNMSAAGVIVSDWVTLGEAFDATKSYVVSFFFSSSGSPSMASAALTGAQLYYEYPGTTDAAGTTTGPSGGGLGNNVANTLFFISKLEVQSSGGGGAGAIGIELPRRMFLRR